VEAAEHVLSAVVSTEAASTAVTLAQELRDPTKVLDAASTQGVPSFALKLQEAPSVAVQVKTMLDLPDDVLKAPMPKLSKRLGVEATADVLGVREVIEQRRRPDVATKEKVPTSPKGLGSLFHIRAGRISINNLGGVGSSKKPEELRYSHVASAFGKELDLVLRTVGPYKPRDPALTGIDGHVFAAAINVANDGDVQIEVSIVEKDSDKLVHLPQCYVSVFDIEDPLPALSASGQVEILGAKVMFWRNGTAVPIEEPWAPQGPAAWYPVGEDGTLRLRIRAQRSGGNVLSSAWVGRNFFIALRSPAVTVQEEIDAPARGGLEKVIFNNLGGQGPGHLDEPPEIRYAAVGSIIGDNVDLVISVGRGSDPYQPEEASFNAASGHLRAAVSVPREVWNFSGPTGAVAKTAVRTRGAEGSPEVSVCRGEKEVALPQRRTPLELTRTAQHSFSFKTSRQN
ncbi:unnamed protein product, partial [Symbiodinium sp. KB8]